MARAVGLIAVPLVIYLSFFYAHFTILTHSGPGDTFMSPAFQETLLDNELLLNSQGTFADYIVEQGLNQSMYRYSIL
jgi:dolichyl-phosphate-mannose-protein mannosyltransferase